MKPFNLQEALEGKPIVTRDGRKVLDFHYFKDINSDENYCICAVIENEASIYTFAIDGRFMFIRGQNPQDLFMYEEPKTYYANVYRYSDDVVQISNGILSKEQMVKMGESNKNYLKTIEIIIP